MNANVNMEEIKSYNARLKTSKEQINRYQAEIEYTQKELQNHLAELSQTLGMTVTVDNIEEVYNNEVNKINTMLQSGKAVLDKIDNVNNAETTQVEQSVVPVMQTVGQIDNNGIQVGVAPQQVDMSNQQVSTPVTPTPVNNVFNGTPVTPVSDGQSTGTIFGTAPLVNPVGTVGGQQATSIPPLFNI